MPATKRKRRELPGNPAGAIYGTIVTAGLLVPKYSGHSVWGPVLSVAGTLVVFWLAHAYTDLLGGVIVQGEHAEGGGLWRALRVEWPIVESGVFPIVVVLVARWVGATTPTAMLSGLVVAGLELLGWAWLATRRSGVPVRQRLPYVLVSAVLGAAIVVLKAAIH